MGVHKPLACMVWVVGVNRKGGNVWVVSFWSLKMPQKRRNHGVRVRYFPRTRVFFAPPCPPGQSEQPLPPLSIVLVACNTQSTPPPRRREGRSKGPTVQAADLVQLPTSHPPIHPPPPHLSRSTPPPIPPPPPTPHTRGGQQQKAETHTHECRPAAPPSWVCGPSGRCTPSHQHSPTPSPLSIPPPTPPTPRCGGHSRPLPGEEEEEELGAGCPEVGRWVGGAREGGLLCFLTHPPTHVSTRPGSSSSIRTNPYSSISSISPPPPPPPPPSSSSACQRGG